MNIEGLITNFEDIITEAATERYGGAAERTFTIYKDVVMYLITHGKLAMNDREDNFWNYTKTYSLSALYRVAEAHRKNTGAPALRYEQRAYHNRENTIEEWRGLQS